MTSATREGLPLLLQELRAARDIEQAARAFLARLLAATQAASPADSAIRPAILRAVLHLRPAGYRALSVLEANGRALHAPDPETTEFLSSSTVWRAVEQLRRPVSIDLVRGTVRPLASTEPMSDAARTLASGDSRQRFLGRRTTNMLAVPLLALDGSAVGMANVEAHDDSDGADQLWAECGEHLQLIADFATLHLLALPIPDPGPEPVDELLPVVGSAVGALMPILRTFARQEETLLITGPTGSGKSRLARWCHEQSARCGAPFETLDLMSVPEDLQMAELFGWKKGAFSSAVKDTVGAVGRARGGTLFIDEVDKLSLKAQAGLLQLLERRTFRVLGDSGGDQPADVRFLVGTNADLAALARAGQFREDLYFRINVLPVRVPPLDERRDEIGPWAEYMVRRRHGGAPGTARLTDDAKACLERASWPGNLRQLDNIIRRAYSLALAGRGENAGAAGLDFPISGVHIEQALAYEKPALRFQAAELWQAARRLVAAARAQKGAFTLEHAEAFRGLVLAAAIESAGPEGALRWLGKDNLLANRNHQRLMRRESERLRELGRAVGFDPEPAVLALLAAPEDP